MRQIRFTAANRAEFADLEQNEGELGPHQVAGRTLASLISPGTELNWSATTSNFPYFPGYAAVFEVDEVGENVTQVELGDRILCTGPHRERQTLAAADVIPVPGGLASAEAVFARLAGVSMATLATTSARPPSEVLVTGLGPVGNLAAQIFQHCGYRVTAVDPLEARRDLALQHGVRQVFASMTEVESAFALHLECSGLQQPVVDGCQLVAKGGEVVLVGVPWQRQSQVEAFDLLHAVFHRYVRVRSGWEWEVPDKAVGEARNSHCANYAAAMRWIADGHLRVDGLAFVADPRGAAATYHSLAHGSASAPTAVFDWTLLAAA